MLSGKSGDRLGIKLEFKLEVNWEKRCFLIDFEDLEGFKGGADFLDFLVVITDSINNNFLFVKNNDIS